MEVLSEDEFIPNTPQLPKVASKLFVNKSKNIKTIIPKKEKSKPSKRKVLCSPNSNDEKRKQQTLSSFVTRLKRKKSLDPIPDAEKINPLALFTNHTYCDEKTETKMIVCTDDGTKNNSLYTSSAEKAATGDVCDDIVCTMDALNFENVNVASNSPNNNCVEKEVINHGTADQDISIVVDAELCRVAEAQPCRVADADPCRVADGINNWNDSVVWSSDFEWDKIDIEATSCSKGSINNEYPYKTDNNSVIESDSKFKVADIKKDFIHHEVVLFLSSIEGALNRRCTLKGFWIDTLVEIGDEVRIIAPFINGQATINDQVGFLVVNPDFLISSTAVVSTLFCMRKAALSHKLRYWDSTNAIMLTGSMVHELFQQAINDHFSSEVQLNNLINNILKRSENIISMYCQGITESGMLNELNNFAPSITQWIAQYCSSRSNKSGGYDGVRVTGIRDIEDNIWCPRYGIKGKIDLTVDVDLQKKHMFMPLELKTGKASFSAEHQGQVNLYTLMMKDRSDQQTDGLLLYLRDHPEMRCISSEHSAHRGLIQLRNELVHYLHKGHTMLQTSKDMSPCYLPEPLNSKRLCQKCPYLLPCTVYQRVNGKVKTESSHAMSDLVPSTTSHLTDDNLKFYQQWSHLLNLESASAETSSFWNTDAETREKEGLCFSHMVLKNEYLSQQTREGGVYIHRFFRSKDSPTKASLLSVGIKDGDYIIISNQKNNLEVALATGFVANVGADFVNVSVERDIQQLERYQGYIFRIDKLENSYSSGAIGQMNLMKLISCNEHALLLRKHVIEKKTPEFRPTMSKKVAVFASPFVKTLNKLQRKAIFKALMAKDYMLLKGMPGSGKSSTIVALVRVLVEMDYTVLLTSHTHSAVDNILLKLLDYRTDFLRFGQLPKIHKKIHPHSFELLKENITSVTQLQDLMKSAKIIATTCMGVNNVMLRNLKFDVCIIDESSQITLPDCLGPLFLAKKFILVGDPMQLPPVVANKEAKIQGLDKSLFSYLETTFNCMELVVQYRMNSEIMRLSNALAYDGVMECGSDVIANSTLKFDDFKCPSSEWLNVALSNELKCSAVFLNTDPISGFETRDNQGRIKNDVENQLVHLLVDKLVQYGLNSCDIGVIAPYRCQVELIAKSLGENVKMREIEVNTVDQYQGRDKEAIIISCVRSKCDSSEDNTISSTIMGDERRLTVAISRAKKKIIIIGSRNTLTNVACFNKLFNILRVDQILDLPLNAAQSISGDI